jgi:large subunit ribosomal protein L1
MKLDEAIKILRESKKRNFSQSIDLIFSLRNIDLKKPENKFSKDVVLPHGKGKDVIVGIISDRIPDAINKNQIMELEQDKKALRKFVRKYDFFLCEAPLMPIVGKILGRYLGPIGKMPKLLPPGQRVEPILEDAKNSVRIRVRDSPVMQCMIGTEVMDDKKIKENAERVINEVKSALPKGHTQIKYVFIKTTMGKPVKIDL